MRSIKLGKLKKNLSDHKEKEKAISQEKSLRVITAEGWKNYLRKKYFPKK